MNKIDIRDLRVNDWIYHKDCPIPLQVSGLKDNEVYLKHSFEYNRTVGFIRQDRHSMCSIDKIMPIPLTPDMLLTNYFELQELGGEKISIWTGFGEDNCHDVEVEFEGIKPVYLKIIGPVYLTTTDIEYLHHLQHFLKDCKTDIEITI